MLGLPLFAALAEARRSLLAGAAGGSDICSGLPLYFGLRAAGKTIHLANLSFSDLYAPRRASSHPALVWSRPARALAAPTSRICTDPLTGLCAAVARFSEHEAQVAPGEWRSRGSRSAWA